VPRNVTLPRPPQDGFTLLEIVVAIVLLGILASIAVFSFDGSKSRGQMLVSAMEEYGNALLRMKADTACYPRTLEALFSQPASETSFCGVDLRRQWNGPYAKTARVDGSGNVLLDQIAPNATLSIANASGGAGMQWMVVASNVPSEIVTQALIACNGSDAGQGHCQADGLGTGANLMTLRLKFTETR
jgi:prepilin-type N-terminal cleavage/methylation domain-containing protein